MILLSAENLEKNFGERILFSNLNIGLKSGDKAALIAANGTGKTSLLRILAGKDEPEAGKIAISKSSRIAILEQEPFFEGKLSISQQIKISSTRITNIIADYQSSLNNNDANALEKATLAMDMSDAWDYERKLTEMLDRFAIKDLEQKINTLSGGQLKRLALALTLMDNPDLLLLDEPTNHLDIDMIEWLEEYLSKSNVSFLMVTHDRYFLDNVCNLIFELENQNLYSHIGNYELFLRNKAERENTEAAELQKAKSYVRNELDWMRRMPKARSSKSKSRIDNFYDKYDKAHQVKVKENLKLEIQMNRLGGKILDMKNVSKSFDDITILDDFSYNFRKGERIGIIGSNGSGKTSFINLLSGRYQPDKGVIDIGETIVMSHYHQEGIKYDESKKIIEIVSDIAEVIKTGNGSMITASQFLQQFMFSPKVQHQQVSSLSGGEKRRLYLLTVLIKNPNFLILDEPTNDLDLITLTKLEDFLAGFGGCLIIVSHDRYMLDKLCDNLLIFEGQGKIRNFIGHYTEYREEKLQEIAAERIQKKEKAKSQQKEQKPSKKPKKGLSFKEKMEFENLEKEIQNLEKEKQILETKINSGISDYQELGKLSSQVTELITLLDTKEERWLELDEKSGSI